MMSRANIRKIVFAGVLAALYAALTVSLSPISYGNFQFRAAEALMVLPFFFPFSVWGLFIGCILANIISPYPLDIVVGSLASLIAGFCTMQIGKMGKNSVSVKALACFPPVIINAIFIGLLIAFYMVGFSDLPTFFATAFVSGIQVGFGQLVVLYVIGLPLLIYLPKSRAYVEMTEYLGGN